MRHSGKRKADLSDAARSACQYQECASRRPQAARNQKGCERLTVEVFGGRTMIRKLASGKFRLYSRKKNPSTGKRRNLGTFTSKRAAQQHERAIQYFKRH
jgi:hypothetical protein